MGILLDTSVLIALERGRGRLSNDHEVAIAAIAVSELLQGVYRADPRHRPGREAFVERVIARFPTIPFTLSVARTHARLWSDAVAAGRPRGANDLMIAATAIALGWSLATVDLRGFGDIEGLSVIRL